LVRTLPYNSVLPISLYTSSTYIVTALDRILTRSTEPPKTPSETLIEPALCF